jgi:hypothetical protein
MTISPHQGDGSVETQPIDWRHSRRRSEGEDEQIDRESTHSDATSAIGVVGNAFG